MERAGKLALGDGECAERQAKLVGDLLDAHRSPRPDQSADTSQGDDGARGPRLGPAVSNDPDTDHAIISRYGAEYRGIVQYYLLAGDVFRLNRLHWVMQTSLLKTLAGKHDSSVVKMARKYRATIDTPHGPRKCLQASTQRGEGKKPLVAAFGGIPLKRQTNAVLRDREPVPAYARRKELVHRLLAGRCELCGQADKVRVHQIRKLADLDKPGQPQPEWAQIMARRRRKTLVVCDPCHANIHPRRPTASTTEKPLESPVS